MQEITEKEINIYTSLPVKVQEHIAINCYGPIWIKSKHGFGYNLHLDRGLTKTQSYYTVKPRPNKIWTQVGGIVTPSSTAVGNAGATHITTGQGISTTGIGTIGTISPYSYGTTVSISDYLERTQAHEVVCGIPYNVDDILEGIYDFVYQIYKDGMNEEDEEETYFQNIFSYNLGESKNAQILLEGEEHNIEADTYRELILKMFQLVSEHVIETAKPSITELKHVQNIFKIDEENYVSLSDVHYAMNITKSLKYSLFTDSEIGSNYHPMGGYSDYRMYHSTVKFIEGEFHIYTNHEKEFPTDLRTAINTTNSLIQNGIVSNSTGTGLISSSGLSVTGTTTFLDPTCSSTSSTGDLHIDGNLHINGGITINGQDLTIGSTGEISLTGGGFTVGLDETN